MPGPRTLIDNVYVFTDKLIIDMHMYVSLRQTLYIA